MCRTWPIQKFCQNARRSEKVSNGRSYRYKGNGNTIGNASNMSSSDREKSEMNAIKLEH